MERPNLILTNTCHQEPYTAPQSGRGKPAIARNPALHAAKLNKELQDAFATDGDRRAHAVADRHGIYLEFTGPQNGDLATKSLEDIRQGVRLLNVREEDGVMRATVFIPSGKERFFLDRVKAYGDPHQVTKKGKPRHEKLVSSIEDIRLAIVDSLWTGSDGKRPADQKQWLEIWLRTGKDEDGGSFEAYAALLDTLHIGHKSTFILFPERMVTLAYASKADLASLPNSYDGLAEIKEAPLASSFFANLEAFEQREWIDDLLSRTSFAPGRASVCILDTGINSGHPLLSPAVDGDVVLAYDDALGIEDRDNHGTKLAGLVLGKR